MARRRRMASPERQQASVFTLSFSTVACREWTHERVALAADEYGYDGVELRTFDDGASPLACEPALSAPGKLRRIYGRDGVQIVGVGASTRFDAPINPPLIGLVIGDQLASVREAKRHIRVAQTIGAPLVRVFAFEIPGAEKREACVRRIVQRLQLAADDARHTGVRLCVENGGDFSTAEQICELVDRVDSPLVGVSFNMATCAYTGRDPVDELRAIGSRLLSARIKDVRDGVPCLPGDGALPCREFVHALVRGDFETPLVFEWDRLWSPDIAAPEEALPEASARIFSWVREAQPTSHSASGSTPVAV